MPSLISSPDGPSTSSGSTNVAPTSSPSFSTSTTTTVVVDEPTQLEPKWTEVGSLVVAALALATAITGAILALRSFRSQRLQLAKLTEGAKQEMASRFAVWLEPGESSSGYVVKFHNGNSVPVYDVVLRFLTGARLPHGYQAGIIPPTISTETHSGATESLRGIIRRRDMSFVKQPQVADSATASPFTGAPAVDPKIDAVFRDAKNNWWRRDATGQLHDVSTEIPDSEFLALDDNPSWVDR